MLSEPVYGDGMIVDPLHKRAYAVSSVPGAERVIKEIKINQRRMIKQVRIVPWPDIPRAWETPTAGTYAEGFFYVADAAIGRLQGSDDNVPGLIFALPVVPGE